MPADYSKDRLGYRSLQLMDETSQWGYRKYQLGETDTFEAHPNHELYAHLNVNYMQLPAMPPKDDWSTVVDAIKNGRFFTTTGEVLIHSWNATEDGVTADVEWYFPPAFAEISWGDDAGVHKLKKPLADLTEFGRSQIQFEADLSGAKWVRFEFWDVARNGAFTQPHWFECLRRSLRSWREKPPASRSSIRTPTRPFRATIPSRRMRCSIARFSPQTSRFARNTSPWIMDRLILNFNGTVITDTSWPYTIAPTTDAPGVGDSPGYDYPPLSLAAGSHTITATPVSRRDGRQAAHVEFYGHRHPASRRADGSGSERGQPECRVELERGARGVELQRQAIPRVGRTLHDGWYADGNESNRHRSKQRHSVLLCRFRRRSVRGSELCGGRSNAGPGGCARGTFHAGSGGRRGRTNRRRAGLARAREILQRRGGRLPSTIPVPLNSRTSQTTTSEQMTRPDIS